MRAVCDRHIDEATSDFNAAVLRNSLCGGSGIVVKPSSHASNNGARNAERVVVSESPHVYLLDRKETKMPCVKTPRTEYLMATTGPSKRKGAVTPAPILMEAMS